MKKKLILSLLFLLSIAPAFCQHPAEPVYYIYHDRIEDAAEIKNINLNTENIESLNIEGQKIYVKTKKPLACLSLNEILKKYTTIDVRKTPAIYTIGNNLISDIESLKIDASYFIYVEIEKFETLNYINKKYKDLVLVKIALESKEREAKIWIRGEGSLTSQK